MSKRGLSNQMLGKTIEPITGLAHVWNVASNTAGDQYATVQAAWVQEGNVKFLISGPMGDMGEVFATHVKIRNVT